MKRFRVSLMSVAIIGALASAFTTVPKDPDCIGWPQYWKDAVGVYRPAGTAGVHYHCDPFPAITCTYYFENGQFIHCVDGEFMQGVLAK